MNDDSFTRQSPSEVSSFAFFMERLRRRKDSTSANSVSMTPEY